MVAVHGLYLFLAWAILSLCCWDAFGIISHWSGTGILCLVCIDLVSESMFDGRSKWAGLTFIGRQGMGIRVG
jgi:hypothetical protein